MTEGQIRYQTLMENQRHNLAVERYSEIQARAAEKQAEASAITAGANQKNAEVKYAQAIWEMGVKWPKEYRHMIIHDNNQDRIAWYRTGAAMMGGLFGAVGTIGNLIA